MLDSDEIAGLIAAASRGYRAVIAAAVFTGRVRVSFWASGGRTWTSRRASSMCAASLTGAGSS